MGFPLRGTSFVRSFVRCNRFEVKYLKVFKHVSLMEGVYGGSARDKNVCDVSQYIKMKLCTSIKLSTD